MAEQDLSQPFGASGGGVPMMAPPPTFNPAGAAGLPPPDPGRGSRTAKHRTRRRYDGAEADSGAPKSAGREPPLPGLNPEMGSVSVFTPAAMEPPAPASDLPEAAPEPEPEPVTNLAAEQPVEQEQDIAQEDAVVTDAVEAPQNDGWDPEGGSFEPPADTPAQSGWDDIEGSSAAIIEEPAPTTFEQEPEDVQQYPEEDLAPPPASTGKKTKRKVKGRLGDHAPAIPAATLTAFVPAAPMESAAEEDSEVIGSIVNEPETTEFAELAVGEEESSGVVLEDATRETEPEAEPQVSPVAAEDMEGGWADPEEGPLAVTSEDNTAFVQQEEAVDPEAQPAEESEQIEIIEAATISLEDSQSAAVDESAEAVPKTRKKKKRVGEHTEVPEQPSFASVEDAEQAAESQPAKKTKKTKKTKKAKKAAAQVEPVAEEPAVAEPEAEAAPEESADGWGEEWKVDDFDTAQQVGALDVQVDEVAQADANVDVPVDQPVESAFEESGWDIADDSGVAVQEPAPEHSAAVAEDGWDNWGDEAQPIEPQEETQPIESQEETQIMEAEQLADEIHAPEEVESSGKAKGGKKKKKKVTKKTTAQIEELQRQLEALAQENANLRQALINPETKAEFVTSDVLDELERLRASSSEQQVRIDELVSRIEELQNNPSSLSSSGSESDALDRVHALELQNAQLQTMHAEAVKLRDQISADKKHLEEHVEKLSADLERLRQEQEVAKKETAQLQEQCRSVLEKWNSYRESIGSERKLASAELDAAAREHERLAAERKQFDAERAQLRQEMEDLRTEQSALFEAKEKLAAEQDAFEATRHSLNQQLEVLQGQVESFLREKEQFDELKAKMSEEDPFERKAEHSSSEFEEQVHDLTEKLQSTELRLSEEQKKVATSNNLVEELNAQIASLIQQHQKVEEGRKVELEDLQRRYNSALKKLKESEDYREELNERLSAAERDKEELRDDLKAERQRTTATLRESHDKLSLLQHELDAVIENNKSLVQQRDDLEAKLEAIRLQTPAPASTTSVLAPEPTPAEETADGWGDDEFEDFGAPAPKPSASSEPASVPAAASVPSATLEELEKAKDELKSALDLVMRYENEIEEMSETLASRSEEKAALTAQVTQLQFDLDAANADSQNRLAVIADLETLNEELRTQIESLERQQKPEASSQEITQLKEEIEALQAELKATRHEMHTAEQQRDALLKKVHALEQQLVEHKAEMDGWGNASETELRDLRERLRQNENHEHDRMAQVKQVLQLDIDNLRDALDEVSAERDQLRQQLEQTQQNLQDQAELLEKIGVAEREIESQMNQIDTLQEEAAQLRQRLEETTAATTAAATSVPVAVEPAPVASGWDAEFAEEKKPDTSSVISDLNAELADLRASLEFKENDLREAQRAVEALKQENAELDSQLTSLRGEVRLAEHLQAQIDSLQSALQEKDRKYDAFEMQMEEQVAMHEQRVVELLASQEALQQELAKLKEAHQAELAAVASAPKEDPRIPELEERIASLESELQAAADAKRQLASVEAELKTLRDTASLAESQSIQEIEQLREQLDEAMQNAGNASEAQELLAELREKLAEKTKQLMESVSMNEEYMAQVATLSKQVKHLNEQLATQTAASQTLQATVEERDRDLDALGADLEASNIRLAELQRELHARDSAVEQFKASVQDFEANTARLKQEYESQLQQLETELEEESAQVNSLEAQLNEARAAASQRAGMSEDERVAIAMQLEKEWSEQLQQANEQHAVEVAALNKAMEDAKMQFSAQFEPELERLNERIQHLQESNVRISEELQTRDEELVTKTTALDEARERVRSLEEQYKEQVIAADQFMNETSNYRKQIKQLNEKLEKLSQEKQSLQSQLAAITSDFEGATSRIVSLEEKMKERSGASDAQVAELAATNARLKAELSTLHIQLDQELMAKDQEIERIRIEKQEEHERMSMQLDDLFREREEINIRMESSTAEVSRATVRFQNAQRELEEQRSQFTQSLRALQAEKDQLEESSRSLELKLMAYEAENKAVGENMQQQLRDVTAQLEVAQEERDRLEQAVLSLERDLSEERIKIEQRNLEHVQQIRTLQQSNETLNAQLAEETAKNTTTIANLMQRLEHMQIHTEERTREDKFVDELKQQLADKDKLVQSLLQEKDELVQRLVVSTQDASAPIDQIAKAKEDLEIQVFRLQEAIRMATAENAALRERLQVETQRDQVTKLNTAIEILKREKDELSKQLNAFRSGSVESETIATLRAEKQQLSQMLFTKTMELEETLQERKALQRRISADLPVPVTPAKAPALAAPATPATSATAPTNTPTSPAKSGTEEPPAPTGAAGEVTPGEPGPGQPGWTGVVSGVWNVIWGTD